LRTASASEWLCSAGYISYPQSAREMMSQTIGLIETQTRLSDQT
jgi:hypothetical protein